MCAKIQNSLMCKQAINLELPLLIYFKRRLHWCQKPVHFTHTVYSGILLDAPQKKDHFAKLH